MTVAATQNDQGWYRASAMQPESRPSLTFDLDVEVCVIGGGLAGLSVALEIARLGGSVAILEAREIGWNASGNNLGAVTPGFGSDVGNLIARVGLDDARQLWALTLEGAERIRNVVEESQMPGVEIVPGALDVSNTDNGDQLVRRLQRLSEDFATDVEGWQTEQVRAVLKTPRYFHAVHYPKSFHLHGLNYARGLAAMAERAGVRIFEHTPVVGIDPAGIRKRITTQKARLRAYSIVLAGNVHLGSSFQRLARTLLPVWRYAAVTEPLGDKLAEAIAYRGAVSESSGVDHYRIVDGDRLMWSAPVRTWEANSRRLQRSIQRSIRDVFPQLGNVAISDTWCGVTGETVHGMPQIGPLRRGVWVASGFGRQGLSTCAMAGQVVARGLLAGDDRWRLFSPFELVWTGGLAGRVAGQAVYSWSRQQSALAGTLARYRERARLRDRQREIRRAAANEAVRTMRVSGAGPRPRAPSPPPGGE